MKKTMKTMAAVALCAVAVAAMFSSCSTTKKVPSQEEIEKKIIGKWKIASSNGKETLTNRKEVVTFNADGTEVFSTSRIYKEYKTHFWLNQIMSTYTIEGNQLKEKTLSNDIPGNLSPDVESIYYSNVLAVDGQYLELDYTNLLINGKEKQFEKYRLKMQKMTVDYSQDIIGMWEGVAITGDETYGDANHRIEYKADGTYEYYSLVNGKWETVEDAFNEYNVDGDWLATRWQEKGSDVMNYEWWDIDYIKGDEMKWSALRAKEDGTRFTTTFTWKRVK